MAALQREIHRPHSLRRRQVRRLTARGSGAVGDGRICAVNRHNRNELAKDFGAGFDNADRATKKPQHISAYVRRFYRCGGCDHFHPLGWLGDCRDDFNRFSEEQIEKLYGPEGAGWHEVDESTMLSDLVPLSLLFSGSDFSPCACNAEGPCQHHGDDENVIAMLSLLRKIAVRVANGLPVLFDAETEDWLLETTGYTGKRKVTT